MEQLIYAIDVYEGEECVEIYEVAECYADETIERLEAQGLDYTVSIYQYYVPCWHYDNK